MKAANNVITRQVRERANAKNMGRAIWLLLPTPVLSINAMPFSAGFFFVFLFRTDFYCFICCCFYQCIRSMIETRTKSGRYLLVLQQFVWLPGDKVWSKFLSGSSNVVMIAMQSVQKYYSSIKNEMLLCPNNCDFNHKFLHSILPRIEHIFLIYLYHRMIQYKHKLRKSYNNNGG